MHAPNFTPQDGLVYKTIHSADVQASRRIKTVTVGPGGSDHDYVPFYFGYLSPMLLQLHTGRVQGYTEGQRPIIYMVSTAQAVEESGTQFVFTNGHSLPAITEQFDDLAKLDEVDWDVVYERYWCDKPEDNDKQRRKQAEFLVYRFCNWSLVDSIAVIDQTMQETVEEIFQSFPGTLRKPVHIKKEWYY
jgi:hypothetical protein